MTISVLHPYNILAFQWLFLVLFTIVGEGYYSIAFGKASESRHPLTGMVDRFVLGIVLLLLAEIALSLVASVFSIAALVYLSVGCVLALRSVLLRFKKQELRIDTLRSSFAKTMQNIPFAAFLILTVIATILVSLSLAGYVASTAHDAAVHTFYTRIILEQQRIPITAEPFLDFAIFYPLGSQALMAVLVVLGVPMHSVALITSSVFPLVTALTVYASFARIYDSTLIGATSGALAALATRTVVSTLGWGGVPLGLGNMIFFASLYYTYHLFIKSTVSRLEIVLASTTVGLTLWLHPASAFLCTLWTGVCFILGGLIFFRNWWQKNGNGSKLELRKTLHFILVILLIVAVYLLRMMSIMAISLEGYPVDVLVLPDQSFPGFTYWLPFLDFFTPLDLPAFIDYLGIFGTVFRLSLLSLVICTIYYLIRRANILDQRIISSIEEHFTPLPTALSWSVLAAFLIVMIYVIPVLPPDNLIFGAIQDIYGRLFYQANLLMIAPLAVLIAAGIMALRFSVSSIGKFARAKHGGRRLVPFAVLATIMSSAMLVCVGNCVVIDTQTLYSRVSSTQAKYNIVTVEDVNLMMWMVSNLNQSSVILIGHNDAGDYVTAVTGLKTIYPYVDPIKLASAYNTLLDIISDNPLNSSALSVLEELEVTHVFIGAKAGSWSTGYSGRTLYASELVTADWFEIEMNFGNATLLRFVH